MGAFLARLFSQFAVVGCCVSLNVMLVSLAALIRQLPALADFLRRALRWWLVLSYRVYNGVLSRVSLLLRVNLLAGLPRTLFALGVSLLAGLGLHHLLGLSPGLWTLTPFALHGLLVGGLWDELAEPGGIRLGERL